VTDDPPQEPFLLSGEHRTEWTISMYEIRAAELCLTRLVDPRPGSPLAAADRHYKWEKASSWSRAYLRAAADNLGFWSDLVAPYEFEPGHVNNVGYRPYLLLGRSGLEAAAHGLWLLAAENSVDCVGRLVRLMHRDFTYHVKAIESGGGDASRITQRITDLEARCAGLDPVPNPKARPPRYEDLVKLAATICEKDESEWAYYWNAASGAAHGQNWFSIEGFEVAFREEYEPGHYRTVTTPDPEFITATIGAAATALKHATCRWMMTAGYPLELMTIAMTEVFERMPKKDRDV
jgi:hypothetical protein